MTRLADRLCALAADSEAINFTTIALPNDVVESEAATVAAGPFSALLAEAIAHAYDHGEAQWTNTAASFAAGLAGQHSFLHLTSTLEALLRSPQTTQALAKSLNNALLNGFADTLRQTPLLAAARLEGAVRLATSKAVSPYKVWGTLDELPTNGPEDFLERVPRILGVALDCWAQEEAVTSTVRGLLEQLSVDEAADAGAMFELGCDRLRQALSSSSLADVTRQTAEARRYFAAAGAAEEARDEASVYAAVCDALLGFTSHDTDKVSAAADAIENAMHRRAAWLLGTHQPAWLQPRVSAEIAWSRLLLQLRAASDLLHQPVWMDPWRALDAVLAAYRSARTVQPVGNAAELTGLAALVEPAIEEGFLKQQSFLAALQHAAQQPHEHPDAVFDATTAAQLASNLSKRMQDRQQNTTPQRSSDLDEDDQSGRTASRLHRLAPTLVLNLGLDDALRIAQGLDDSALLIIEGIAYNGDVARLKASDPLIIPQLDRLIAELSAFPDFTGEVRHTFEALVEQTLLFLKSRSDLTSKSLLGPGRKGEKPYDYRRQPEQGQRAPLEDDLQRDFHGWLQAGPLHNIVSVEPIDAALGRADVLVHFGALRYLTEIKMDSTDNTRDHLERKYLTQASEYSNTNAPFGQLLVLDLTNKATGTQRIDELTWVTSHRPDGATIDRAVVAGIVTGNRVTPSVYSR
ncbi:hypothetical protein [Streptomyces sp. YPW6]|uniref:hypothetical protein n=1 Tax=Streptomyces sp. YPW6 TaxID=2840373 RepID=UPI003D723B81